MFSMRSIVRKLMVSLRGILIKYWLICKAKDKAHREENLLLRVLREAKAHLKNRSINNNKS